MSTTKTRLIASAAAALAALALTGCSSYNDARGKGDAPVGPTDDSPAQIVNFPDGFGNVAIKCDGHGHRLYVATHVKTDPSVTVIADPSCAGGSNG